MVHRLRPRIRFDIDEPLATVTITGCLTPDSSRAVFPLLRRIQALTPHARIVVDLSRARHIDAAAVKALQAQGLPTATAHPRSTACSAPCPDSAPAAALPGASSELPAPLSSTLALFPERTAA